MKKPVLGIIGVGLLQVAFVAYSAYELPVDLSGVAPARELAQAPADLGPIEDDIVVFRSGTQAREVSPKVNVPVREFAAVKRERRPLPKTYTRRTQLTLAVQKKPVRTEYPIAPLAYRQPENAVAASIVTRQPKKRSFFAKALPIIKKPYDWARTIAGKLN